MSHAHTHTFSLTVTVTAVSRLPADSLILHYPGVRLRFRLVCSVWFVCASKRYLLKEHLSGMLENESWILSCAEMFVCLFVCGNRGASQDLFLRQRWRFWWRQGQAADEGQDTGQWWGETFSPNWTFIGKKLQKWNVTAHFFGIIGYKSIFPIPFLQKRDQSHEPN